MAAGSAQVPFLACRASASAAARSAAQSLSVTSVETSASPRPKQLALHRRFGAGEEHEGRLAAVAVRRVVLAVQRHVAPGDDRRQRRGALVLSDRGRLDAGEADLAAVVEPKGARVDHGGDAAFALRLEGAAGGIGRSVPTAAAGRQAATHARNAMPFWS